MIENTEAYERRKATFARFNTVSNVESVFVDLLEQQAAMHDQMAEHFREAARLIQNSNEY